MTALALQAFLEEKDPILVSRIINSKAFKESRESVTSLSLRKMNIIFNHLSLVPKIWAVEFPEPLKISSSMVYIVVNGLLVEAETVTEIHMQVEVRRHRVVYPRKKCKSLKEDDIITDIVREAIKQMKGE